MGIGASAVNAFFEEGGNVIILDITAPAEEVQNKYAGIYILLFVMFRGMNR